MPLRGPLTEVREGGSATATPGRRPPADKPSTRSRKQMNVRHSRLARLVTLTVVASMPLLGMAGVASAKVHHAKHHHHGGGGSTGGGTGGPPALITVRVSPNPLVETGQSEIHAVIEVETSPSFAGDDGEHRLVPAGVLLPGCPVREPAERWHDHQPEREREPHHRCPRRRWQRHRGRGRLGLRSGDQRDRG